jgi:hypothetical protein
VLTLSPQCVVLQVLVLVGFIVFFRIACHWLLNWSATKTAKA